MTDLRLGALDYGLRGSLARIVDEFLRFVRQEGAPTPRPGGAVQDVLALDAEVAAYFERGQV